MLRNGFWVGPTIILHQNRDDAALHDEIFGPVLSILVVESKEGSWAKFSVEFPSQAVEPFPDQVSNKLNGSTIALVCRRKETVDQVRKLFINCPGSVNFISMDSMSEIAEQKCLTPNGNLLCLVDDDLYDESAKDDLLNLQPFQQVSVTTFGSRRYYGAGGPPHIRSLTRTLPSVLLQHLESQILPIPTALRRSKSEDGCAVEPSAYRDFRVLVAEDVSLHCV